MTPHLHDNHNMWCKWPMWGTHTNFCLSFPLRKKQPSGRNSIWTIELMCSLSEVPSLPWFCHVPSGWEVHISTMWRGLLACTRNEKASDNSGYQSRTVSVRAAKGKVVIIISLMESYCLTTCCEMLQGKQRTSGGGEMHPHLPFQSYIENRSECQSEFKVQFDILSFHIKVPMGTHASAKATK